MEIKLRSIASEIGIVPKTLSIYLTGELRSKLVSRKISDYTEIPWQMLQKMRPADVEAAVVQAYLDKHYPWLKDSRCPDFNYENVYEECA